jgi:hypothetical protein
MLQRETMKSPLIFVMMAASYAIPAMGQAESKPTPQAATVYVYRIKVRLVAKAFRPLIYFDGFELGQPCTNGPVSTAAPSNTPICAIQLATGEYLSHELPAGKHSISATLSEASQSFDVEPGKEYFFKLDHKNLLKNRKPITLTLIPMEKARREMEGLRKR